MLSHSTMWFLLAFVFFLVFKPTNSEAKVEFKDCGLEIDIVFVLDGSKSVNQKNFNFMIKALTHFIELILANENSIVQVGMVLYSSSVTDTIALTNNLASLKKSIFALKYPDAGTHTDEAIDAAKTLFETTGRKAGSDIMIVITDGISYDPKKTQAAAERAKASGINIFIVGINQYKNEEQKAKMQAELRAIASSSDQVTELDEFGDFEGVVLHLASRVCTVIFEIDLKNVTVPVGDTISLSGRTNEAQNFSSWKHNGVVIKNGGRYHITVNGATYNLTISDAKLSDNGKYVLTVGESKSRAHVTVLEFLQDLQNMSVDSGKDIVLEAEYRLAGAKATWYFNGKEITNGGRYAISVNGTKHRLVIKGGTTADGGNYMIKIDKFESSGYVTIVVHGGWSVWSKKIHGDCSASCDGGVWNVTRTRKCNNPVPKNGGRDCNGSDILITTEACNTYKCGTAVNGGWGSWGNGIEAACTKTCGGGTSHVYRVRLCNDPPPINGGRLCVGDSRQTYTKLCNTKTCPDAPVDGGWSEWGAPGFPSACSVTCGTGTRTVHRARGCINPKPKNGGADCAGPKIKKETQNCTILCAKFLKELADTGVDAGQNLTLEGEVDREGITGRWFFNGTKISNGGRYSVRVDGKKHTLIVTGAKIEDSGLYVLKVNGSESKSNVTVYVNGGWSKWSVFNQTKCSQHCVKTATLVRSCDNPPPKHGGKPCSGSSFDVEMESCDDNLCVSHKYLSPLQNKTVTSGNDFKMKAVYTLDQSIPKWFINDKRIKNGSHYIFLHDGQSYTLQVKGALRNDSGKYTVQIGKDRSEAYVTVIVNGAWSAWQEVSGTCSQTCGTGTRTVSKNRTCDNPAPANGGKTCTGSDKEVKKEKCKLEDCPVNGGWSAWVIEQSGNCSVTCGTGTRTVTRTRKCDNPLPESGGKNCTGNDREEKQEECKLRACSVNGGWGAWGKEVYGKCSVTCGTGKRTITRTRKCDNPAPVNGGKTCPGENKQVKEETCTLKKCSVNGAWGPWGTKFYGSCSATCDSGTRSVTRTRLCNNPEPAYGGDKCPGSNKDVTYENCHLRNCTINGAWGPWGKEQIGKCSVTCGTGTRTVIRTRKCDSPAPENGGKKCTGNDKEEKQAECKLPVCPKFLKGPSNKVVRTGDNIILEAEFSIPNKSATWFHNGTKINYVGQYVIYAKDKRHRLVVNAAKQSDAGVYTIQIGGLKASAAVKVEAVSGQWGPWGTEHFNTCSVSCGVGFRIVTRSRVCMNPSTGGVGTNCPGNSKTERKESCEMKNCPGDGAWGPWGTKAYGTCSVTCGSGKRSVTRKRLCNNPAPSNGGKYCPGNDKDIVYENCVIKECTVDGAWNAWSNEQVGNCSVTCGNGVRTIVRTRKCDNPAPANGGKTCPGKDKEEKQSVCKLPDCPADGGWSPWGGEHFGTCSVTCGLGIRIVTKTRLCNNPAPANNGRNCTGKSKEVRQESCKIKDCAVNGAWGAWGGETFGSCSVTCGNGTQVITRLRLCNNPAPANGGNKCPGKNSQQRTAVCFQKTCKIDGQWGSWSESRGPCSKTCGGGQQTLTRKRLCNNPKPENGGRHCVGNGTDELKVACNTMKCPGSWSQWTTTMTTECTVTCGQGSKISYKKRTCNGGKIGETGCVGPVITTEVTTCTRTPCFGTWGPWTVDSTSKCSVTCGVGFQTKKRTRICTIGNAAQACQGSSISAITASCNPGVCPGRWSSWNIISRSPCSVTCGKGKQEVVMNRTCIGGAAGQIGCQGLTGTTKLETCVMEVCKGKWSGWSDYSSTSCSKSCGPGIKTVYRSRKCIGGSVGQRGCIGNTNGTETRPCNDGECRGRWSIWHDVSATSCSVTCGVGQMTVNMSRDCIGGTAGKLGCEGSKTKSETRSCNKGSCSGHWSAWKDTSSTPCSVTCGNGTFIVYMQRTCIDGTPGKIGCPGSQYSQQVQKCNPAVCQGKWSEWKSISSTACSVSCGNGLKTVTSVRTCIGAKAGDPGCSGPTKKSEMKMCKEKDCIGRWSEWTISSSTACSVSCGQGIKTVHLIRTCIGGNIGGSGCIGSARKSEMRLCNEKVCVGKWSEWTITSSTTCSVSCGQGINTVQLTRTCIGGNIGGPGCIGSASKSEVRPCNEKACGGHWTEWTIRTATACSLTCGQGVRTVILIRNCSGGEIGGPGCIGSSYKSEIRVCSDKVCSGKWSNWTLSSSSSCSASCGQGTKTVTLTRICIGGKIGEAGCIGTPTKSEMRLCNEAVCPGNWNEWKVVTSTVCSVTCGEGVKTVTLTRTCIGGKGCPGASSKTEVRACNEKICLAKWSEWEKSSSTPCSVSCGAGTRTVYYTRRCLSGTVGQPGCEGSNKTSRTESCNQQCGTWSKWKTVSQTSCSASCGSGFKTVRLTRTCIGGIAGQRGCEGKTEDEEAMACSNGPCPGQWSGWTKYITSKCSVSCGPGTRTFRKTRSCIGGTIGQKGCEGLAQMTGTELCNEVACPGKWTEWKLISSGSCSVTCGAGNKTVRLSRTCIGGLIGEKGCIGPSEKSETRPCSRSSCPGMWGSWNTDSTTRCSQTCGRGQKTVYSSRVCIRGNDGKTGCQGSARKSETVACNEGPCPATWGAWQMYSSSSCSVTCGPGVKTVYFQRFCKGSSANDQPKCDGPTRKSERQSCNYGACLGSWSAWNVETQSACSVTCGTGSHTVQLTRRCIAGTYGKGGCIGRTTKLETRRCEKETCSALCTTAEVIQGVGYRNHPTDCNKYLQCYFTPNGSTVAVYRTCPFGYYWDQSSLRCNPSCRVNCSHDQCRDMKVNNYNMDGSCRAYWECRSGKSEAACCPVGFAYVPGKGCVLSLSCRDPCPTACTTTGTCLMRPVWNSKNDYEISIGALGWIKSQCLKNHLQFDLTECGCVARNQSDCKAEFNLQFENNTHQNSALYSVNVNGGVAAFSGASRIRSNVAPPKQVSCSDLVLNLKFKESKEGVSPQVLVTTKNCTCDQQVHVVVTLESDNVVFELQSKYGVVARLPVSTRGFVKSEWKEITLIYDGRTLMGVTKSGKLQYSSRILAAFDNLIYCCLDFGTSFKGEMDDIALYRCRPSFV